MQKRAIVVFVLVALTMPSWVTAAAAAPSEKVEHCVVHVVDQRADGELIVSEPACYGTFDEAMRAEGVDATSQAALESDDGTMAAGATFTIGTHFDGLGFTGASTSVVGSNCSGGWLNVSSAWNNRISSTLNGCPRIRHYNGYNLSGTFQTTVEPGGNLTTLNNLTSSLQYLT